MGKESGASLPLIITEGEVQGGQCADDSSLCAQDQAAERGFLKTAGLSCSKLRVGPAAFGPDRQDCLCRPLPTQNFPERQSYCALGKHYAEAVFEVSERALWCVQNVYRRRCYAPTLLCTCTE